jgi:hypothetical protein
MNGTSGTGELIVAIVVIALSAVVFYQVILNGS